MLQLDAIAQHQWETGSELRSQRNPVSAHFNVCQREDLLNDVVDVELGFLGPSFFQERPHPLDHLAPEVAPYRAREGPALMAKELALQQP